jgi:hypothetical protein
MSPCYPFPAFKVNFVAKAMIVELNEFKTIIF